MEAVIEMLTQEARKIQIEIGNYDTEMERLRNRREAIKVARDAALARAQAYATAIETLKGLP